MKRGMVLGVVIGVGALSMAVAGFQNPPAGAGQGRGEGGGRGPQRTSHTHGDHNGSNEFFGATVEIVAQENTKTNMEKMDAFKGDKSVFLPKKTYKDKLSIGKGAEQIDLYYFGPAHTNGDSFVVFRSLRVMHSGDAFAGKTTPIVDGNNGGSVVSYGNTLAKVASGIKDVDTIITGHSPLMKPADLKQYAEFNTDLAKWIETQKKAGKTVDQAADEYKIPEQVPRLSGQYVPWWHQRRHSDGVQRAGQEIARRAPMRRGISLAALVVVGALSIVAAATQAPPAGPSAAALAATKIEKVKDNLYIVTGSGVANRDAFSGGNVAVLVTDAGVVIVDTKLPGWGQAIVDRIKTVTDKPITTIINTHAHGDHTGSNEFFGTTVDSVVQENTKANMERMDAFKGDKVGFLPKRTYKDKMTLGSGKNQIDLHYFGRGHTNGDTFVVFPTLRVMHAGDMFAWKDLPFIDVANGGSVVEHPKTLAKAYAAANRTVDTIITGHTPLMKPADLQEYASFNNDFVAWAENQMKAGKSADEAAAAYKTPAKYQGYETPQAMRIKTNIEAVYNELKK